MIPVQTRLGIPSGPQRAALRQLTRKLRVSMPGIVVANQDGNAFNPEKMTVSVQPAVQEVIRVNSVPTIMTLPVLDDVPIVLPTAGGWSVTFPIAIGDECDLVFADMSFDHWWESSGVQKQPDGKLYRHDIRDAKAHFGMRSVPNAVPDYSLDSMQLRSDDGTVVIDLAEAGITLTAPKVTIVSPETVISAAGGSGSAAGVPNAAWLVWFTTNVVPYLTAHGYTGPPPPTANSTTTLKAE